MATISSKQRLSDITLFPYMEQHIARLCQQGQYRTAETYASTLNSFHRFRQHIDLPFKELDSDLMLAYEYHLRAKGLAPNTRTFYIKRIRAIYSKAVEDGWVEDRHPFRRVSTASEKTVKRAISLKHIKRLKELDLSTSVPQCLARDLFLFSFYTRGMSFVDMAHLRKKDLHGHVLTYRRKKTGQLLTIRWEPCMQQILERHAAAGTSPYLLSLISNPDGDTRKQCHTVQTYINRHLKKIGETLHLSIPLTMYVARHSWASIAHSEGIPVSVISEAMGHDSERTTQIYLASLETEVINRANRKILRLL